MDIPLGILAGFVALWLIAAARFLAVKYGLDDGLDEDF